MRTAGCEEGAAAVAGRAAVHATGRKGRNVSG